MSDQGRYRKLFVAIFFHPAFISLTDAEKMLAVYLLCGPQTNRLGLFRFSIAQAAEDLGTVPETLKKRLAKVCVGFGWLFDNRARTLYIPSWFKWNPPENVNVMRGALKDLLEVPISALTEAFARNVEYLSDQPEIRGGVSVTVRGTFIEGLRQYLPQRPGIQYQGAVSVSDQEQKSALTRGSAGASRLSSVPERPKSEEQGGGDENRVDVAALLTSARQVMRVTSPRAPMDHLLDAFRAVHQGEYPKSAAINAINVVLSERRQATA